DAVALGLQRLDRLGAGIVELAGLADDDGAGADDEDRGYVGALGHLGLLGSETCPNTRNPPRRPERASSSGAGFTAGVAGRVPPAEPSCTAEKSLSVAYCPDRRRSRSS